MPRHFTPPYSTASPEAQGDDYIQLEEEFRGRKRRRSLESSQFEPMDPVKKRQRSDRSRTGTASMQLDTNTPLVYPLLQRTPDLSPERVVHPLSRSRSRSPSRILLARLERSWPSFVFATEEAPRDRPMAVRQLEESLRVWSVNSGCGVVPAEFKQYLEKEDIDLLPENAYALDSSEDQEEEGQEEQKLERDYTKRGRLSAVERWHYVQNIYREAKQCDAMHKDENAWVDVARLVLRASGFTYPSNGVLETESVQSQNIIEDLLPLTRGPDGKEYRIAKKLDLALAIVPRVASEDASLLKTAFMRHGPLSQMSDSYTQTHPMVCGIEVKGCNGDSLEAKAQFAIWSAAGLMHVRKLTKQPASDVLPFLGFIVVDHRWALHFIWLDSDDQVRSWGPVVECKTSTYLGIFKLLRLLANIEQWVSSVYWPWLREHLRT